jgi:phosphoribosylformimino-5-aminoimidazole carboxamide ribotide isomerase
MLVIPAIDLKGGRCVRLRQGDLQEETVYSDDPASVAQRWEQEGAKLLHVVDLDGAVGGVPRNLPQIEAILKAVSVPVQVGGGIRSIETVRSYFGRGIRRVVLGTAALQDRQLLAQASKEFPGSVWIGLDARDGRLAIRGWTAESDLSVATLLPTLTPYALAGVIYTDIARDGMLSGPNLPALREVLQASPVPVIASGGVTRIDDIRALRALGRRLEGVIVGKALYEGRFALAAAVAAAASRIEAGG